jgi:DoxX-like family
MLLGLATAFGWRVRLMGAIQIVLMLGFMAILSAAMPELWLHPFGPLTKNVPLIAATLVMMALEE